ncbi:hypothetical protein C445_03073 [Halobiforma lacisalsi AJ5]|uniref:Uncharacterized protein n=1 Tax=Natronobacterium lacisalsi AJ5 TaxID=358396 RepID=M0LVI3_NATLA|nr:hypothetical protein C445_03073 [Halobiforma lacisalsi AJ5]
MCAAVEEVLTLEVDVGPVAVAQVGRVVQRRRPAGELLEVVPELGLKRLGGRHVVVGGRQSLEGFLERFRNVSAPVFVERPLLVCTVGHTWGVAVHRKVSSAGRGPRE